MSYELPIDIILGELSTCYENGIIKATRSFGFDIKKDELKKALLYDRGQYEKGYQDGKEESLNKVLETITQEMDEVNCVEPKYWLRLNSIRECVLSFKKED